MVCLRTEASTQSTELLMPSMRTLMSRWLDDASLIKEDDVPEEIGKRIA